LPLCHPPGGRPSTPLLKLAPDPHDASRIGLEIFRQHHQIPNKNFACFSI
jgi:hypothetical protein